MLRRQAKGGTITVWTDGSGTTGGPAGIGFHAIVEEIVWAIEGSKSLADATNQQAEILAAAFALGELPAGSDVTVVSDSEYLVFGWNDYPRRKRNANLDHWERLTEATARHR
ncbi:MAG: hypothetical protein M3Q92_11365, partial [Actinomycetota bacterium]|nr:hypothetical protein [Actinomycetota bacterium]